MVKHVIGSIALVLAACVFLACKSAPKPAPAEPQTENNASSAPQTAETPPPPPPPATDETYAQVEQRYYNGLILDGARTYTVVWGDTLTRIARKEWGPSHDPYFFPVFILASRDTVTDPDLIVPGMRLTIPDLQRNLDDATARANIKALLQDISGFYSRSNRKHKNEMVTNLNRLSGRL